MNPELKRIVLNNLLVLLLYLSTVFGSIFLVVELFVRKNNECGYRKHLTKFFSGSERLKLWKARFCLVAIPMILLICLISSHVSNLLNILPTAEASVFHSGHATELSHISLSKKQKHPMKITFLRADNTEEILDWNPENFSTHLSNLPLTDELVRADKLNLCSPTLSIIKEEGTDILWASIITDPEMGGFSFVLGYIHEGRNDDLVDITLNEFLDVAEDYIKGVDISPKFDTPRNRNVGKKGFFSRLFGF